MCLDIRYPLSESSPYLSDYGKELHLGYSWDGIVIGINQSPNGAQKENQENMPFSSSVVLEMEKSYK